MSSRPPELRLHHTDRHVDSQVDYCIYTVNKAAGRGGHNVAPPPTLAVSCSFSATEMLLLPSSGETLATWPHTNTHEISEAFDF